MRCRVAFLSFALVSFGLNIGCEVSELEWPMIPGPRYPIADYTVDFDYGFPGTVFTLQSIARDPDGRIAEYSWWIDGVRHSGPTVQGVHFDQPGEYSVVHIVTDLDAMSDTTASVIRVKPFPHLRIRLVGIWSDPRADLGDGLDKRAELYMLSAAANELPSRQMTASLQVQPPGAPGQLTWDLWPGQQKDFGPNSGVILFDGQARSVLGLCLVLMEHDTPPFDWAGLFGSILSSIGRIVAPMYPVVGAVLEGLGQISDLISDAIQSQTQDNVIVHTEKLLTPQDRYGVGEVHPVYFPERGVAVWYSVEEVP